MIMKKSSVGSMAHEISSVDFEDILADCIDSITQPTWKAFSFGVEIFYSYFQYPENIRRIESLD